ncbi:putative reverse transcriptase domain-containing protein [Tanacetum coccineum]
MPPRRLKKKSIKRLVEKHVAKAIEEYEKNRDNLDSAGSSGGNPVNAGGTMNVHDEGGGIYFFDRIWIPSVGGVRKLIMDEAHTSRYLIHPGADKMYHDLRDLYWWPGMKRDIARLPRSSGVYDAIWVIVDRLTKSAHFLPICEDYKTEKLARIYINEIVARHGVPVLEIEGLLKVSPWKGVVRFGKKGKLAPRYVGPFEIVECVGPVAYRLKLPQELSCVHDTFHVSNLKKCLAEPDVQEPIR